MNFNINLSSEGTFWYCKEGNREYRVEYSKYELNFRKTTCLWISCVKPIHNIDIHIHVDTK